MHPFRGLSLLSGNHGTVTRIAVFKRCTGISLTDNIKEFSLTWAYVPGYDAYESDIVYDVSL